MCVQVCDLIRTVPTLSTVFVVNEGRLSNRMFSGNRFGDH